jgi:indolepyruvate ferredoxin oxidoreductase
MLAASADEDFTRMSVTRGHQPRLRTTMNALAVTPAEQNPSSPIDSRLDQQDGRVFLTGIQALIRLMVEQSRRDKVSGLKTGGFVTGYPGSPLGGMEGALGAARSVLKQCGIVHQPGQNEELAATSLIGTQMIDEHPSNGFDGVVGYWYGKGPGVDRSGDAMKHGNFAATSKNGAVVVLSGEDHEAKSSTVPYAQEFAFEHFGIPVLYPASVAEFITLGQHAVAMSRYSGCWVAMKLTGPLCDGGETVDLSTIQPQIVIPDLKINGKPFEKSTNFRFFPVVNIATEQKLYYERHEAVRAYARSNNIDQIVVRGPHDRIGIIAAGKAYSDARQALRELGWSDRKLQESGVRILKLGMLCPLQSGIVREFAEGLDQVIVIEEKRDFLERQVGRALCDLPRPPRLVGKFDSDGNVLFPLEGGFDHDLVAEILGRILGKSVAIPDTGGSRLEQIERIRSRAVKASPRRTPTYCSGCPHNVGTTLPPGQIAWGAPGCHVFAAIMSEPTRRIEAVTQFGGEGLPWIGLAPFTARKHIVQNIGDGSLFHSSYLNIRYAVATNSTITFKILYNGAIANTGGQPPVGQRSVQQLTSLLLIEGVKRIILIAKNPKLYADRSLPKAVEVRDSEAIEAAQQELAATEGVTVLIYDGECANERRRKQKRGNLPKPTEFTIVNEDVCENCGHCGEVSSCMSLQKINTEFGKKTRIHQSSCNQDMSCIRGNCPSFVTVVTEAGKGVHRPKAPNIAVLEDLQAPRLSEPYHICIPGVGGTGVITVNAILAQAATLDGYRAVSFDQTGAAQKWGPVLSSLIVAPTDDPICTNNVGLGRADLYLALDLVAASNHNNLQRCSSERSAAVINTDVLPTGEMARNVRLAIARDPLVQSIVAVSDRTRNVRVDAGKIAETMFGDYMMTNMVATGAAYEARLIPVSASAIEKAIEFNGVAVRANIMAFRAGRMAVRNPAALEVANSRSDQPYADRVAELKLHQDKRLIAAHSQLLALLPHMPAALENTVRIRIDDLIEYQNASYAKKYVRVLQVIMKAEREVTRSAPVLPLTETVARYLYKLMAYKDEYEVARLLTQETFRRNTRALFDSKVRIFYHLQPQLLRLLGVRKKVRLGEWFTPFLRLLKSLRFLRSTPFDIFGYNSVRSLERGLIEWYIGLVETTASGLTIGNISDAQAIMAIPEDIRGYEDIKARSAAQAKARAAELVLNFRGHDAPRQRAASA